MITTIPADLSPYPGKQEDVIHSPATWALPEFAETPLAKLVDEYQVHLRSRSDQVSPSTPKTYAMSINNFIGHLRRHGDPLVLAAVTPFAVKRWVIEQRDEKRREEGISTRLNQLKVFTRKFIWKELELTTKDLLDRVERIEVKPKVVPALSPSEIDRIIDELDRPRFTDVRDRAFLAVCASTGQRFNEVLQMSVSGLDKVSGEFLTVLKGGDEHLARMSPKALKLVKSYIRARPDGSPDSLWLSSEGTPLSYSGGQGIFRRLRDRVPSDRRLHAHLFRHTFAQHALSAGAERALVQDMLGHKTDKMTRRYTGSVRKSTAARSMPSYTPF